jgi:hypothetical protein
MAVVTSKRHRVLHACDTRLTYLAFLIVSKGDRKEAASAAADLDEAVAEVLQGKPKKIQRHAENTVWIPAVEALGVRSWLWFVIAAVFAVASVLAVPRSLTHSPYIWIAQALVPALPSALFLSRQMSHMVTRRVVRTGIAQPSSIRWVGRWHSDAVVLILTLAAWGAWMTAFAP